MGRLIDADKLIEVLTKYKFGAISNDTEREVIKETVLNFVKEQPTAYDVENVVAELERWSTEAEIILPISKDTIETKVIASGNAIDIVKRGGVE